MKRRYAWLLSLLAFAPLAAMADSAWVTTPANLRAGPDVGYPSIAVLPAGTEVELYGCVDDWSWCDVETAYDRGWISAGLLDYDWDGQRVEVYDYGPQLSLPIVSFVFGTYWDNYYRGRPWYRQRSHWSNYHPVHRPRPPHRPVQHLPPRPPHHADRPRPSTPMPARPVPRPHAAPSRPHDAPSQRPGRPGIAPPDRPRPAVQPARPVPSVQPVRPAPRPATHASSPSRPVAQPHPQPARPAPRPVSRPSVQPRPQPAARPAAKPAPRPAAPVRSHAPASQDKDKGDKQRR